jgi:hypothetical protein
VGPLLKGFFDYNDSRIPGKNTRLTTFMGKFIAKFVIISLKLAQRCIFCMTNKIPKRSFQLVVINF